jgi:hypothetical protein
VCYYTNAIHDDSKKYKNMVEGNITNRQRTNKRQVRVKTMERVSKTMLLHKRTIARLFKEWSVERF